MAGRPGCARALASARGVDINCRDRRSGRTALHAICALKHAVLAEHLLVAGGCRFALTTAGRDRTYQRTCQSSSVIDTVELLHVVTNYLLPG